MLPKDTHDFITGNVSSAAMVCMVMLFNLFYLTIEYTQYSIIDISYESNLPTFDLETGARTMTIIKPLH